MSGGHILGQKLQLLRHTPLDNGIVLIQPHGQPLAIENLLLDFTFHETTDFVGCGIASPLRLEYEYELGEIVDS